MNNILVIGNGFDRAHGLKTSYSDFINFYNFISNHKEFFKNNTSKLKEELEKAMNVEYSDVKINYLRENFKDEKSIEEIGKNSWFNLIQKCIDDIKPEWSNLEHFIGLAMKCLCKMENNVDIDFHEYDDYAYNHEIYDTLDKDFKNLSRTNSDLEDFRLIRKLTEKYIKDFKSFSEYLGLYLKHYLNDVKYKIDGFTGLSNNYNFVLSFNYTNTFSNVYKPDNKSIHFIHGSTKNISKLVFGTDTEIECIVDDRKLAYESFRKYFQRIVYGTGNTYKEWLNNRNGHILFYGFSFAIEDKKAIKELIDSGKKIFIFYVNDQALTNIVKNLSIILTEEKLIELTGNDKIVFINDLNDKGFQKEIAEYKRYLENLNLQKEENENLEELFNYGIR